MSGEEKHVHYQDEVFVEDLGYEEEGPKHLPRIRSLEKALSEGDADPGFEERRRMADSERKVRRLSRLVRRDSYVKSHHCMGVFTSGGDSQGEGRVHF